MPDDDTLDAAGDGGEDFVGDGAEDAGEFGDRRVFAENGDRVTDPGIDARDIQHAHVHADIAHGGDYANYEIIRKLFRENMDLFQLAAETCRGGKHFVFVHAGLSRGWMDRYVKGWTAENMVRELNRLNDEALDAPTPEETSFAEALSLTDRLRGGDAEYASPVWIDALSLHEGPQISEVIQIVGHTAIRGKDLPVLTRNVIYTDCQKGLILGSRGALRYLDVTRCGGKEDPFHPKPNPYENKPFGLDWFERPFCRRCGSHNIYIRAGMFVDHWYCRDCGNDALM